jgi:4-hydroxy-tetrahydrodipicolinate synthase
LILLKAELTKEFALISGDDLSFVDYLKKGGNAVISVTANLVPKQMHLYAKKFRKIIIARQKHVK